MFVDEIHCGEISFSYFFDGFKKLVESSLIDFFGKDISPGDECLLIVLIFKDETFFKSLEFDSMWFS